MSLNIYDYIHFIKKHLGTIKKLNGPLILYNSNDIIIYVRIFSVRKNPFIFNERISPKILINYVPGYIINNDIVDNDKCNVSFKYNNEKPEFIIEVISYVNNEVQSINKKPAIIRYNKDFQKISEEWYMSGKCHRIGRPAVVEYSPIGAKEQEIYYFNDTVHRTNGPAIIKYYPEINKLKMVAFVENNKFSFSKNTQFSVCFYYTSGQEKILMSFLDGALKSHFQYYSNGNNYYSYVCVDSYIFSKSFYYKNKNKKYTSESRVNSSDSLTNNTLEIEIIDILYDKDKNIIKKIYKNKNGVYHNQYGPAVIYYHKNGAIKSHLYYYNGILHRLGKPAFIIYDKYGYIVSQKYYNYFENLQDL